MENLKPEKKIRNYGLEWIESEELFKVTKKHFEKVYRRMEKPLDINNSKNAIDPFTAVFQIGGTPILDYESWVAAENSRQLIKTLQNAVGSWHQSVLGLAKGWQEKGASGGVFDIESTEPQIGFGENPQTPKNVIIEVKNKFNTIKASDEHKTHSNLHNQASSRTNTVAYLVQVVPKAQDRYNRKWSPSKSFPSNKVFVIDGATAYDLIFKQQNALHQIYSIIPAILQDVREDLKLSDGIKSCVQITPEDWENFQALFNRTFKNI